MKKSICVVAGKSGGHIIPGLHYAKNILDQDPDQDLLFFSTHSKLDADLLAKNTLVTNHIPLTLENIPYKKLYRLPLFGLQLTYSFVKSLFWLIKKRPSLVISMGGYISIPVCLAARLLRIRTEIFELNVIPGKATSFLARHVSLVRTCFPETKKILKRARCILSPYPLKYKQHQTHKTKQEVIEDLLFDPLKKTVFILGGSQGSQFLNKTIQNLIISKTFKNKIQVIHQTGFNDPEPIKTFYKKNKIPHYVFTFHNKLEYLYPAADLIICRAGAGTLFETHYFNKKCISIPLEVSTTTHQKDNARSFQKQFPYQFFILNQKEIESNSSLLKDKVTSLLMQG